MSSSSSSSVSVCVPVGRQTTAPASVSAVAGTTAGIVEQGKLPCYHPLCSALLSLNKKNFLHPWLSLNMINWKSPPPSRVAASHTPAAPRLVLISPPKSFLFPPLLLPNASQMFAKVSSLTSHLGEGFLLHGCCRSHEGKGQGMGCV